MKKSIFLVGGNRCYHFNGKGNATSLTVQVAYLLRDEDALVTGQVFKIDGGLSILR